MQLTIITPQKIEFQEAVDSLILPTLAGEIGVLPHHEPLISVLKEGKIKAKSAKREFSFDIEGGIVKIENDIITILLKKF